MYPSLMKGAQRSKRKPIPLRFTSLSLHDTKLVSYAEMSMIIVWYFPICQVTNYSLYCTTLYSVTLILSTESIWTAQYLTCRVSWQNSTACCTVLYKCTINDGMDHLCDRPSHRSPMGHQWWPDGTSMGAWWPVMRNWSYSSILP